MLAELQGPEIFNNCDVVIYDLDQTTIESARSALIVAEKIFRKEYKLDTSKIDFSVNQATLFNHIKLIGTSLGLSDEEATKVDHMVWDRDDVIGGSGPIVGARGLVEWTHKSGKINWVSSSRPQKHWEITKAQIHRNFGRYIDEIFLNKTNDHKFGIAGKVDVVLEAIKKGLKPLVIDDSSDHIAGILKAVSEYDIHAILSPYASVSYDGNLPLKYPGQVSIIPRGHYQSIWPVHMYLSGLNLVQL